MPDLDGYALIRQVRQLPPDQGGQTPAVAPCSPASRSTSPSPSSPPSSRPLSLTSPAQCPRGKVPPLVGFVSSPAHCAQSAKTAFAERRRRFLLALIGFVSSIGFAWSSNSLRRFFHLGRSGEIRGIAAVVEARVSA